MNTTSTPSKLKTHSIQDAISLIQGSASELLNAIFETGIVDSKIPAANLLRHRISTAELFTAARHMRAEKPSAMISGPATILFHSVNGGAGTTTLAANIALALSLRGLRVVQIDCDPGAYATMIFGYEPDYTAKELSDLNMPPKKFIEGHIGSLLQKKALSEIIKKPFGQHGPHIIPADPTLEDLDNIETNTIKKLISHSTHQLLGETVDLSSYEIFIIDSSRRTPRALLNSAAQAASVIAIITPQNRNGIRNAKNFIRLADISEISEKTRFTIIPKAHGNQKFATDESKYHTKITTPLLDSDEHLELLEQSALAMLTADISPEIRDNINRITDEILHMALQSPMSR